MTLIKKNTGTFKSFDGAEIYYEVRGSGRPLIFAYGIGCIINHWHFQLEEFSKKYQTIIFDYRGHSRSDGPYTEAQMTTESIAKDLVALANHLEIPSASFLGHSYGGQVLIKAYELNPDLFHSLILVNGYASNPLDDIFSHGIATKIFNYVKLGHSFLPDTSSFLWKKIVDNPISAKVTAMSGGFNIHLTQLKDIEIYLKGIATIQLELFLALFEDMVNFDGRTLLRSITVPTLLISGEKDGITPLKYQKEMQKKIKNCELLQIPYGSHCSQLDFPEFVNLRIEKFLSDQKY